MKKRQDYSRWETDVGKDCIELDISLCRWLSDRLLFLSEQPKGVNDSWHPEISSFDERVRMWADSLCQHAKALREYAECRSDKPSSGDAPSGPQSWEDEREKQELRLKAAQYAIRFVADNLHQLWD